MEQIIQVHSKRSESLRDVIVADTKGLRDSELLVRKQKTTGRNPGWAEITADAQGTNGVLKISWEPSTQILTCRLENRESGDPFPIIGNFINYLMKKHKSKIKFLVVIPE